MTVFYDDGAIITITLIEAEQRIAQQLIQRRGPDALKEEFEGLFVGRGQRLENEDWKARREKHRVLPREKQQQVDDILEGR